MRKRTNRQSQCKNCQKILSVEDNFCPNCGQENHYVDHSLKEVWGDFISSAFNFDRKVWQTFYTLFRFPGKMSRDFVDGLKVNYVPPFRFYLFLSFVYFLLVNMSGISDENFSVGDSLRNSFSLNSKQVSELVAKNSLTEKIEFLRTDIKEKRMSTALNKALDKYKGHITGFVALDTALYSNGGIIMEIDPLYDSILISNSRMKKKLFIPISMAESIFKDNTIIDSIYKSHNIGFVSRTLARGPAIKQIVYHFDKNKQIADASFRMQYIINKFSYMVLVMLPITGFVLFLFFYRKRKYYYDSFVFSIHAHSHLLLVGIGIYILNLFVESIIPESHSELVFAILAVLILIYTLIHQFIAVKVFYLSSWFKTIVISWLFLILYAIVFLILLVIVIVSSVYF